MTEDSQPASQQSTHCFSNYHLTIEEQGLYSVCFAIAFAHKGKLEFTSRTFAQFFAGDAANGRVGHSKVHYLAKQLEEKGWFKLLHASVRDKDSGQRTKTVYRVLTHQQWAEAHSGACQMIADNPSPESGVTVGPTACMPEQTGDNQAVQGVGVPPMASGRGNHLCNQKDELESCMQERTGSGSPVCRSGQAERVKSRKTTSLPVRPSGLACPNVRTTIQDPHSSALSSYPSSEHMKTSPLERTGEAEPIADAGPLDQRTRLLAWFDNSAGAGGSAGHRNQVEFFQIDCTAEERAVIRKERPEFVVKMENRR